MNAQSFGVDLRRVVIFCFLSKQCAEFAQAHDQCPSQIFNRLEEVQKAFYKLLQTLRSLNPDTATRIEQEMHGDRITDIVGLLDQIINVENIGDVVRIIEDLKAAS